MTRHATLRRTLAPRCLATDRVFRDLDLLHDSEAGVAALDADRRTLEGHAFTVVARRERPSFVVAEVSQGAGVVRVEWTRDSAFRFFPLVRHEVFGLALHPFDLAADKVLALVGRLEVGDWIVLAVLARPFLRACDSCRPSAFGFSRSLSRRSPKCRLRPRRPSLPPVKSRISARASRALAVTPARPPTAAEPDSR
jgi:hypothetical protein